MNQHPEFPPNNDDFDHIISSGYDMSSHYKPDPNPYGIPAQSIPVKPGLTKRGKTALAIAAAVIATGGFVVYQHYSAESAAAQAKTQEYQYKQQLLELEKLKILNQTSSQNQKSQNAAEKTRQKLVDACINTNKGLVGKQMGATYSSVVNDCQAQYPGAANSSDMQTAADTASSVGGGGQNTPGEGLLIGGAVLVIGIGVAARKATRSNQT